MSLPELSVLLLGRNFDDPGLVDDPGGPVALLHDADDPGLVAFLLLNVLKEGLEGGLNELVKIDVVFSSTH